MVWEDSEGWEVGRGQAVEDVEGGVLWVRFRVSFWGQGLFEERSKSGGPFLKRWPDSLATSACRARKRACILSCRRRRLGGVCRRLRDLPLLVGGNGLGSMEKRLEAGGDV